MVFKSALAQMVPALLITIVTGLPFFQATAQVRCEQVFTQASAPKASVFDRENWVIFNNFEIVATRLQNNLMKNRAQMTSFELGIRTVQLQSLTEKYLTSAGITFEKIPTSITITGLKDVSAYQLQYAAYSLTGTAEGAELSRLLYGVQSNPKFAQYTLKVELDPLYFFDGTSKDLRLAHYEIWNKKIRFGPETVSNDLLGLTSNLRHELGHHLNHMKVLNGQMSLARILLESDKEKNGPSTYSKFLLADEIETWLGDLRALLDQEHHRPKDIKYTALVRPEVQSQVAPFLAGERLRQAKQVIDNVERFIEQTRTSLAAIIAPGNIVSIDHLKSKDGRYFMAILLKDSPYEKVRIELTGLITHDEVNTPKVDEVFNAFDLWNQQRLNEVSGELATLKQKFQQKLNALGKE